MRCGEHFLYNKKKDKGVVGKHYHESKTLRFLDELVLLVSVAMPLTTLPQIYKIWTLQDATGLSLITWSLYLLLAFPMLIYGIIHRISPIIVMNILWIFMYLGVIVGVVVY